METKFTPMVPQYNHGQQNQMYAPQPPMVMQPPVTQMSTSNTTVVVNQPQSAAKNVLMVGSLHGTRDWSTGLFGCFGDMESFLCAMFCLPYLECSNAQRAGECFCLPFCVPSATLAIRAKIRAIGGIRGSICNDCVVLSCCGPCATCQLAREMKNMGIP